MSLVGSDEPSEYGEHESPIISQDDMGGLSSANNSDTSTAMLNFRMYRVLI